MKTLLGCTLAAALLAAGCATTTSGDPRGSGSAVPSSSSGPTAVPTASGAPTGFPSGSIPPVTPAPSSSGSSGSGLLDPAAATAALMTTTETGAGFTETKIDTRSTPGPCKPAGSPTIEDTVPSKVRVGVAFDAGTKAFVAEILTVYSDASTAQQALDFGALGLSCAKGTLHGTDGSNTAATITSDGASTKFDEVTVDDVRGWTLKTSTVTIGLIVARVGNALAAVQLGSLKGSNTAELRNGELIVADALRKLKAAS